MNKVKALSDETLLYFMKVLYDYRKGKDITSAEFQLWLADLMSDNLAMDIQRAEILLANEAVDRFGFLVRYLMNRKPEEFIRL